MTEAFTLDGVGFTYDAGPQALDGVDLIVAPGDFVLVVGPSGSGKSTLLRTLNGLVPHSSGGRLSGTIRAFGLDTRAHRPRDLAAHVGFVHQDPEAQFVVDRVESDLAFSLENLGADPATMRRRVEEVLDALGIAHLRDRSPSTLSGGEKQRAAIAGALAASPAALVLDEPTSQLDPQGADDVLAAVARLADELGTTVVVAEHRLDRVAPMADRAVVIDRGRVTGDGNPALVLSGHPGAPPVVALARLLGWDPAPLTVREARRLAAGLVLDPPAETSPAPPGGLLVQARELAVELGRKRVIGPVDFSLAEGEVVALLGRNGAGKTTLLRALAGLVETAAGRVERTGGVAVAYVPQDPGSLLFSETAAAEVAHTLDLLGRPDPAAVERWLARLGLDALSHRHPRSLSGGERQRLAVAAVAVGGAPVLLLDEPTRGMDAPSGRALERAIAEHTGAGGAVVLATHDVELAARVATRVVVLADGEVVADGPAAPVLSGSLFAPQVLRVLPPHLTVEGVARALEARR